MGLQSVDLELMRAHNGARIITISGMVLDGSTDRIEAPPTDIVTDDPDRDGVTNEIPASLVDFMEFYLLNYFKPALYRQTRETDQVKGSSLKQVVPAATSQIFKSTTTGA